jgi:uncharacterized protein (DUF488 family)
VSIVSRAIYTIGHSIHPIAKFLSLLQTHGIEVLADVRSTPASRRNPQFNRDSLRKSLAAAGIEYVFLGEELGARSKDPACYVKGQVQYPLLAQTALFKSGIERLLTERQTRRVAIMCAEQEPLHCHRTLLVTRALQEQGIPVLHILADGQLEEHATTMQRLAAELKLPAADLFTDADTINEMAYAKQAEKIAYRRESVGIKK